ncbi:hypothetical protein H6S10_14910 [Escherichia coli]|nr:hypothetical protein H6S10_14910 [Escherichia coli]
MTLCVIQGALLFIIQSGLWQSQRYTRQSLTLLQQFITQPQQAVEFRMLTVHDQQ